MRLVSWLAYAANRVTLAIYHIEEKMLDREDVVACPTCGGQTTVGHLNDQPDIEFGNGYPEVPPLRATWYGRDVT